MARTGPETRLVGRVIERIKWLGGHARKVHGNVYVSGEPDVDGCLRGRALKVEVKVPGERPTPLQMSVLRRWERAGALAGWVASVDELDELLAHLDEPGWHNPQLRIP